MSADAVPPPSVLPEPKGQGWLVRYSELKHRLAAQDLHSRKKLILWLEEQHGLAHLWDTAMKCAHFDAQHICPGCKLLRWANAP